jgi:predicted permease
MTGVFSDIKFSLRTLGRSPLFTSVAVLSLALGIGANTAIFTLLDQLVLRLLPVNDPEQLVMIWTRGSHVGNNNGSRALSYPMYQDFQQKAEAFSYVFCRFQTALSLHFEGQTERVNAELVSGNFFQALGVKAAVGRVFSPEEDDRQYRGHPVVVLNHHYWVSRFGADPAVVGKKILVNNYPMIVVGVSAAGFYGLDPSSSPHLRVPMQMKPLMTPGWDALGDRRSRWVQVFARMKPGYTAESARVSLEPLFKQILQYEITEPYFNRVTPFQRDRFLQMTTQVEPAGNGYSGMRERYRTALYVLMGMVGLVLVIACANVANLLIARAAARQKEVSVRLAIGASRAQLVRQLLVESVLLSMAGGVVGILLSIWTIRGLFRFLPADGTPLLLQAEPDLRILAFNVGLAVLTGLLFGLAPAWQATRVDLWNTLKDVVGAVAGTGGSARLRKALVTGQVALSFLLLAGAGLFMRSLQNLKRTDTGFREMHNLVTFQVNPGLNGYDIPRERALYKQLLENLRALPGVRSAALAQVPLLHGWEWDSSMQVEGHQPRDGEDMQAFMNALSPGYFQTMGIPLLEGRDFEERDAGERPTVSIVNQKFARHFFGEKSPLGRRLGFGGPVDTPLNIEIVGVVQDSLYEGPREGVRRQVFVPRFQNRNPGNVAFYVRTSLQSEAMFAAIRGEVKKLDAAMPVYEMKTLERQLDETLGTERLIAALSVAFGALATLLAAVGLYGVMAFVVARRTKEVGVRMALGAPAGAVVWLVMKEVVVLLVTGLAVGMPAAYLLSRYVSSQLFGVQPADAATAAAATALLAVVALSAGFIPARRASAIDPIQALRYE